MTKLLSVKDIQERYHCNPATARKYIRDMDHIEHPLMVSEKAVEKWEREKTVLGATAVKIAQMQKKAKRLEGKRNG